jgi:hypothetical protein
MHAVSGDSSDVRGHESEVIDDSCAPEGATNIPVIEPNERLRDLAERFFDLPISKQHMAVAWLFRLVRTEISTGTLEPEGDIIADIFEEALEAAL